MSELPNVVIVISRCSFKKQGYGMRLEEKFPGQWVVDWAFPVNETSAKKEGYDRNNVSGTFLMDPTYPGCPFCQAKNFLLCGWCGKVSCWDGERRTFTCPWCNRSGELNGYIQSLGAGNDL